MQFVLAVLEKELGPLSVEQRKAVLIDHGWTSHETQTMAKTLCQTRGRTLPDPRMKGVVYALTELSKHGKEVPRGEVQPGDFVQYWMYSAGQRNFFGHAGVVEKVQNGRIWLYGAHKSTNGIGVAPDVGLRLTAPLRAIYAVRLK